MSIAKPMYEGFRQFFEAPTRDSLKSLLQTNVGETDHLDFKEVWPDKTKIVKQILAFSNSGAGALVVGVSEIDNNLNSVGLEKSWDKSDIDKTLKAYLPHGINYHVIDFNYDTSEDVKLKGKLFQVMLIEYNPENIPFLCKRAGDGLKNNVVYVRRGTNSTEASHEELQALINSRIETGYSSSSILSFKEHLEHLSLLYSKVEKYNQASNFLSAAVASGFMSKNKNYPKESLDEFIVGLIEKKKMKIKEMLEIL